MRLLLAVVLLEGRGWLLLIPFIFSTLESNLCLHFMKLLDYKN